MWKSSKQKKAEAFERALVELPAAAKDLSERWRHFTDNIKFKDDTGLYEQIRIFSNPASQFVAQKYPNISRTMPLVYFGALLLGVYLAKTHPIELVLDVARSLETENGVDGIYDLVKMFVDGTPNR